MVRWQLSATFMSWVTIRTVEPRRRADRESAPESPRRCGCRGCRSARRRAGSADRPTARARSRRADARRRRARRADDPAGAELDERQQLARALVDFRARPAAQVQRQADILQADQRRQQVEELEDEADLVAAHARQVVVGEAPPATRPSMRTAPEVGRSRPPIRLSSVDFPEPDGPTMETISPGGDRQRDVVERDDAALALRTVW